MKTNIYMDFVAVDDADRVRVEEIDTIVELAGFSDELAAYYVGCYPP